MRAQALRPFTAQHFNLLTIGETDVFSKTVVLTDAQIKALPSTSIVVVPAPGAGFYTVPIHCVIELNAPNNQHYTNVTDETLAQGASDIVVTWGDNWVNAFRAVPMNYFGGFFSGKRVAFCSPFTGVSVPTVAEDQLWAFVMGYTFNGQDRVENNALKVSADNSGGNFTGGDPVNTMAVTVWYETRAFGTA